MKPKSENIRSTKKNNQSFVKIILFSLVVIVCIVILAMIFAPGIAKNYINKHGKELAGRTVHIDNLRYNYFTSTLQIDGFKYFEKNDSDVFMAFDTFMVNMKPLRLLHDEIFIQQLQLVNPSGNIIQNDTVFNFDDIISFFSGTDSAEISKETDNSKSYKLNLNKLEMKNGSVFYTDLELENTLKLEDVSFIIPQIIWSKLDSSKADIEFKLANGGNFASSLNLNANLGEYSGFVKIDHLQLGTFLPYIKQYVKISNYEGTASGFLNFNGRVDDLYQLTVDGKVEIDSLAMFD